MERLRHLSCVLFEDWARFDPCIEEDLTVQTLQANSYYSQIILGRVLVWRGRRLTKFLQRCDQAGQGHLQGPGDLQEAEDRHIAVAALDLAQVRMVQARLDSEGLLGETPLPSIITDGGAEPLQRRVLAMGWHSQMVITAEKGGDAERRQSPSTPQRV